MKFIASFSKEETESDSKAEIVETKVAETQIPETKNTRNILIAYFSRWGNTDFPDGVDATTSASIVIDDNTAVVRPNLLQTKLQK